VVSDVAYQGSYFDFMKLYVRAYHGFCDHNGCLDLPTWNHLWFLPYLWIYTLLLAAIGSRRVQAMGGWLLGQLQGWKLFVLPVAFLAAGRILLLPHWPHTHNLTSDWHNHAMSLPCFLLGAAIARRGEFWQRLENARFAALGFFLATWASLIFFYSTGETYKDWLPLARTVYALCQWSGIVAVCGFGHRHLNFDSAKRRYLTQAVFPVYILHQTLIVCLAMGLRAAGLAPVTEGAMIVVLTFTISFGVFEMVRRVPLLQPLFGLARSSATTAEAPLSVKLSVNSSTFRET
jgi:surface polysaccharide O-acyltransferase-like enzyme